LTALLHKGRRFLIHRELDTGTNPMPLTFSPKAINEQPARLILLAALMSRSSVVEHSGQVQERTSSGNVSAMYPQQSQRLLEGNHWSIATKVRPPQLDLYSICLVSSPQDASAICLANLGFLIMFLMRRVL
jgi:hypothetical protein